MRTAVGATVVVGVALVVGAVALVALLRGSLTSDIRTAAVLRAQDVAGLLDDGALPTDFAVEDEDESFVQVLDSSRRVLAANASAQGRAPVSDVSPGRTRTVRLVADGEASSYVVAAEGARNGALVVLVARNLEPAREGTAVLTRGLAVGVPLLVALVAVTAWVVTGRALRPVEDIRAEVSSISSRRLDRRVPEPPGDDEIARLARTMNAMLDRLQLSRDQQRRFISDASHELRSPISTIRHQLEVAAAHPDGVGVGDLTRELFVESERMERLVEDLLLLARADEQALAPRHQSVDLDDLLLAEAERLRRRGQVGVDATGISGGQVTGDPGQLQRMVRNLVDNAERHAATRVVLALRELDDGGVELAVADDGAGIAEADRERVFHRFTRLDSARNRDVGGAGLGLVIVAEVVRAHGGTVRIDGTGGAKFVVVLPAPTES